MLKRFLALLFLISLLHASDIPHSVKNLDLDRVGYKSFVFIVPSYNNQHYYKRNLDSIFSQTYPNYRIVFIDDASFDGTAELVRAYVTAKNQDFRFILLQNIQQLGSLANIHKGASLCKPHEIIIILDGDDWLFDEKVLEKLNATYADEEVWVTYGQFVYYPSGAPGWAAPLPPEVIANNAFRDHNWTTTHLRSFYAGLCHRIQLKDLMYKGKFFPMAGDLALMWPILEMAGTHSRFIPDCLYVYNTENPINDEKKNKELQSFLGFVTRAKPRYQPVDTPY
jgi:glycosyltransferase involved in cell wall biosynthesis